jgi:hypothetical protein
MPTTIVLGAALVVRWKAWQTPSNQDIARNESVELWQKLRAPYQIPLDKTVAFALRDRKGQRRMSQSTGILGECLPGPVTLQILISGRACGVAGGVEALAPSA